MANSPLTAIISNIGSATADHFNGKFILNKQNLLTLFEDYLQSQFPKIPSFHPHFENSLYQMFEAGGKKFRPIIMLSVIESYSPELLQNALPVAMAIEFIHTYSLIHDDLPTFDDAPLRRGRETLHITYDEVTATLVGDALNTHSFYLIASAPLDSDVKIKLIKELSLGSGLNGMVLGQALDCHFENQKLKIKELEFIHIHKTAKLIASSLKMGAIIANLDREKQDLLYDIGLNLGLLFQVEDDIIDAVKTSDEAGKPTNNDSEKNSYTNLLGVQEAKKYRDSLIIGLKEEFETLEKSLKLKLNKIVNKYFNS